VFAKCGSIYFDAIMPSMAYLVIDVVVLIAVSFALSLSEPLDKLGKERPTSSLLGYHTVGQIGGLTLINFIFFCIAMGIITTHEKYVAWPLKCSDGASWWLFGDNWETMVCFIVFIFQMCFAGLLFGFGTRFRKPVWTNWVLCIMMVGYFISFSVLLLGPENTYTRVFHFPQENHNRYGTPSTTWQMYQNVDEEGFPKFHDNCVAKIAMTEEQYNSVDFACDGACCCVTTGTPDVNAGQWNCGDAYDPTQHSTTWNHLYASWHSDTSTMFAPKFNKNGDYKPGQALMYDTASWDISQLDSNKPGCPAGKKDGIFEPLNSDLIMPENTRWSIWIVCICNQIVSLIFITQMTEGCGREAILNAFNEQIEKDYIKLDL